MLAVGAGVCGVARDAAVVARDPQDGADAIRFNQSAAFGFWKFLLNSNKFTTDIFCSNR